MNMSQFFYERFGIEPVRADSAEAVKAEATAKARAEEYRVMGPMIAVFGALLGLVPLFTSYPRLSILGAVAVVALFVMYFSHLREIRSNAGEAVRRLPVARLPLALLQAYQDDPRVRSMVSDLAKAQQGELYAFQIQAIGCEEHKRLSQEIASDFERDSDTPSKLASGAWRVSAD